MRWPNAESVLVAWGAAIAVFSAGPVLAQTKQAAPSAKVADNPLKGLRSERDDMRGLTWYQHTTSPRQANSNGFFLYFGKEDSGRFTAIRLVARYYAEDWLFVTRAWAKADGVTVDVPQKSGNVLGWERDNSGGNIWEWSDSPVTAAQEVAAVRTLASAKSVTVRFEGKQYYNDRKVSPLQIKAMQEVIAAYEGATGRPWK